MRPSADRNQRSMPPNSLGLNTIRHLLPPNVIPWCPALSCDRRKMRLFRYIVFLDNQLEFTWVLRDFFTIRIPEINS